MRDRKPGHVASGAWESDRLPNAVRDPLLLHENAAAWADLSEQLLLWAFIAAEIPRQVVEYEKRKSNAAYGSASDAEDVLCDWREAETLREAYRKRAPVRCEVVTPNQARAGESFAAVIERGLWDQTPRAVRFLMSPKGQLHIVHTGGSSDERKPGAILRGSRVVADAHTKARAIVAAALRFVTVGDE